VPAYLWWSPPDFPEVDTELKAALEGADPQLVINWSAID
jgi:hypothetical protein